MSPPRETTASQRSAGDRSAARAPSFSLGLTVAAVTLGIALRLVQFFSGTSLWIDELALVNNLAERSLVSLLTEPLGYVQVAPPGFILAEKVLYAAFGPNDWALRMYSLAAGIGSLFAVAIVGRRLPYREMAWLPALLLAVAGPFILQSAQVKPYSGDVFFSLALLAAALRLQTAGTQCLAVPLVLGVLAPWFSFPSTLVLGALGGVLVIAAPHGTRRRLLPLVASWALSALAMLIYSTLLLHAETAQTMQQYWRGVGGFPREVRGALPWLAQQLQALLWSELGFRGVIFWLGTALAGAIVLWRRSRAVLALVATPLALGVLVAALQRYPLAGRVSHWIAALLVILIATAAAGAGRLVRARAWPGLAGIPALLVILGPAATLALSPPPYRIHDIKPVFRSIARRAQPGDWLFVYPGAWHAWRYYGALTGIPAERTVLGRCVRRSQREVLRQLDSVRGRRAWVVFAHVVMAPQRRLMLAYLDSIGVRRHSVAVPEPYVSASASVDAHLYDLRDSTRLRLTTADQYAIPVRDLPNAEARCYLGMVPMRPGYALIGR